MYRPRLGNQVANLPHYPPQQQRRSQFLPIQQENFISNRNYNQNGNFEMRNFIDRGRGGLSNYSQQNDQIEMGNFDDRSVGRRGGLSNYLRQNGFSTQNDKMDNFEVGFRGNGRGVRGRGRGDRGHHRWSPHRENVPRPYQDNLPPFVNPNYVLRPMPNQQPIVEHSVNRNFDHNFIDNNQGYLGRRGRVGTIDGNLFRTNCFRNYRGNQPNQGQGNVLPPINRETLFHSYNRNHQNLNSNQGYDILNTFSTLEADAPSGNAFDEEDLVRPNMVNAYGVPFSSGRNYGSQPVIMSNGNYENYRNYRNNNNGFVPFYPEAQFTGDAEMANRNSRTLQDSDPTINRNERR